MSPSAVGPFAMKRAFTNLVDKRRQIRSDARGGIPTLGRSGSWWWSETADRVFLPSQRKAGICPRSIGWERSRNRATGGGGAWADRRRGRCVLRGHGGDISLRKPARGGGLGRVVSYPAGSLVRLCRTTRAADQAAHWTCVRHHCIPAASDVVNRLARAVPRLSDRL